MTCIFCGEGGNFLCPTCSLLLRRKYSIQVCECGEYFFQNDGEGLITWISCCRECCLLIE